MSGHEEVLELYEAYGAARIGLEELLGRKMGNQKRPVARDLRRALTDINLGRIASAEFQLLRLIGLITDLRLIKDRGDPSLFADFRRRLANSVKRDDWYGIRFEVHTAARFMEREVLFQKTDPPDFTVSYGSGSLYVESGSTHASPVTAEAQLHQRVRRAIRHKAGKQYARRETALFLDISSCVSEAARNKYSEFSLTFPRMVREMLVRDRFGSALLFHYVIIPLSGDSSPRYVYGDNAIDDAWTRVDASDISPELRTFLDRYYPALYKPVQCRWWAVREG